MEIVGAAKRSPSPLGAGGWIAGGLLASIVVTVIVGPLLWPIDANATNLVSKFTGPTAEHPLGTDEFGRDLLGRLLLGGRLSLLGAMLVVLGTTTIGFMAGAVAASRGGRVDAFVSRSIDALLAIPGLVLALGVVGTLGRSFPHLVLVLILTGWPWYARVYRGLVLRELALPYIAAARALGATEWRVLRRHVAPNIFGPTLVLATIDFGNAVLGLASLSFLGLGVQPPQAEWGAMMNGSWAGFQAHPWPVMAPGILISITVLAINVLGDALRDRADPHRLTSTSA